MSAIAEATIPIPAKAGKGYWASVWSRLIKIGGDVRADDHSLDRAGGDLCALYCSDDPFKGSMIRRLRPIGTAGYPLGGDELGRDMLSRLIYGGALDLHGRHAGVVRLRHRLRVGIFAGYIGGWINTLLMRIIDVFFAFPSVLLAIALSGALARAF